MIRFDFKRAALALTITALVAGCSSGVKLDDVPVEDKNASSTAGQGSGSGSSGSTGQSTVTPADMSGSARAGQGPVGVAHVVYFDFDSYTVKSEYQSVLEGHARFLKANTGRKVNLEGHTDQRGGSEYNLALGQKRSEAVRRSLALLGVSDAQMEAVSFGKEKPAAQGASEDAYSQNRRVEFSYR
ncbi:peptidoglycan-associated lipoprotein Pal [Diaphorobacter aerolatus]|uniref:Peptidoglycan-associated lipoprotein n=1 Tax=Diaphorobacter aerolatus TaxID=1288495 RepID=A0A7H0GK87_9BURK|nr:peptidoglycan-associated lipoprotein Pal [Diaphorobacter aerolatus]QNP48703.1 peptidoglycan-associated lipoprotein Pal [Diaphorobacter aerolatus]